MPDDKGTSGHGGRKLAAARKRRGRKYASWRIAPGGIRTRILGVYESGSRAQRLPGRLPQGLIRSSFPASARSPRKPANGHRMEPLWNPMRTMRVAIVRFAEGGGLVPT